ncbi:MAG: Cytidine deaminase, partial [uncultured Rubrobacteraceae bacterium]
DGEDPRRGLPDERGPRGRPDGVRPVQQVPGGGRHPHRGRRRPRRMQRRERLLRPLHLRRKERRYQHGLRRSGRPAHKERRRVQPEHLAVLSVRCLPAVPARVRLRGGCGGGRLGPPAPLPLRGDTAKLFRPGRPV